MVGGGEVWMIVRESASPAHPKERGTFSRASRAWEQSLRLQRQTELEAQLLSPVAPSTTTCLINSHSIISPFSPSFLPWEILQPPGKDLKLPIMSGIIRMPDHWHVLGTLAYAAGKGKPTNQTKANKPKNNKKPIVVGGGRACL